MTNPSEDKLIRGDFLYIDMDRADLPLEDFTSRMATILADIKAKGGENIKVEVDSDGDISFTFERLETEREVQCRLERIADAARHREATRAREAARKTEELFATRAQKLEAFKQLAKELGIETDER